MEYYVYVIKSLKDRWVYVGITNNVKNRLKLHSTEKVRSTKSKVPFILKYAENCKDSKEARKRELCFKSNAGKEYLRRRGFL